MKLSILSDEHYDAFMGIQIESAYKMGKNEWECETKDGFLFVRVTAAVLSCGFSESECYRKDEMCIVGGATEKKDKLIISTKYILPYGNQEPKTITFKEIVDFMNWQIDDDKIWDG